MKRLLRRRLFACTLISALVGVAGCRPEEVPTPTPEPTLTEVREVGTEIPCSYAAEVDSPPDNNLIVRPLDDFQVTWALRNTGTCDWVGVELVPASTEAGAPESVPVPATDPSEIAEVSIELSASLTPVQYTTDWKLRAPDGTLFGPALSAEIAVEAYAPVTPQTPYGVVSDLGCTLDAEFVEDITVADGTIVEPGEPFEKTWRIRNIGTCNWLTGTILMGRSSNALGGSQTAEVPTVKAGETVDVTLELTAPDQNGVYAGWWQLQSPEGKLYGAGLYTEIQVGTGVAVNSSGSAPSGAVPEQTIFTPYIHNISFHSREIFLDGQSKGNRANVFSKVGDSLTDIWAFLNLIGDGIYSLGDYAYLQPAINYYSQSTARTGNSFNNVSYAAVSGWSSFDAVNPAKVADVCPGMIPVECEYSIVKPAVAIIMIGTNDTTAAFDRGAFEGNLRQVVEASINHGVIPVLSTVPFDQWGDAQAYNQIIISLAVAYDIPWMDFYGATWDLPNHGISAADGVHPSVPPGNDPTNFTAENLQYGHTVRNLLVLHVLDSLWRQVLAY